MPENKVTKRKRLKIKDKTPETDKGGAPSLGERELINEQKELAYFLAIPMSDDAIRKTPLPSTGEPVSKHCLSTWRDLPLMQEEIAKWKKVLGSEHLEKARRMYEELVNESFQMIVRLARDNKLSQKNAIDNVNAYLVNTGMMQYQTNIGERKTILTETETKKLGSVIKKKEISYETPIPDDEQFEGLDDETIDIEEENKEDESI